MLKLKHLKTLQHVSIIIQIIFREFAGSLSKSLNLKMQKVNCGDGAARYDLSPCTGCHRRNGPNFWRVFLMLKYTDITQNTYVQS